MNEKTEPILNLSDVDKVLKERGSVYGKYKHGNTLRSEIMLLIHDRYLSVHGCFMDKEDEYMILDIVNKLTRIAVCPHHEDSWLDIQGYAKLIHKMLKER